MIYIALACVILPGYLLDCVLMSTKTMLSRATVLTSLRTWGVVQQPMYRSRQPSCCRSRHFSSPLERAFSLVSVLPCLICINSDIFAVVAFRNFGTRRIILQGTASNLEQRSDPIPLFPSNMQMFWGLVVIIFSMWFTMRRGLRPWIS